MTERELYGVTVRLRERGQWSAKSYTYESAFLCVKGDKVIVPTIDWFSVGEVISCQQGYAFRADVKYEKLICRISL